MTDSPIRFAHHKSRCDRVARLLPPRLAGLLLSIFALGGAVACTTIRIDEEDAFDRKRTVNLGAIRARGVEVTETRLEVEPGLELDVRHFEPPEARATVLFFGGNGFLMVTAHDWVETLLAQDVGILMFDYRGYGQSGGQPSVSALKADALRVYEFATQERGIDRAHLILHGHSMGTLAATWVATQRPAAALVLESPLTNVEALLDHLTPWLVDLFVSFEVDPSLEAENNEARVAEVETRVLILVGEDDKVTPKVMAEDLHAAAPEGSRLVVIPGHGHNDLPSTTPYRDAYRTLVGSLSASAAADRHSTP